MPKNNKKSVDEYHNERAAVKPPAKTGAQRSREYRARQNALTNVANLCTATQQPSTSVFINNDADNNCVNVYGNRSNTSTQEQAMYSHPSIVVQVDTHQQSTPVLCGEPSTSAVRDGQNITAIARKSTAKTATERSREYRTRIKRAMKDSIEARATLVETVTSAPHKTSAERTRLYRVRMRAKQNTTEPQPTTDTITKQLEANSPPLSGMDDSSELGIVNMHLPYSDYPRHQKAHNEFTKKFIDNSSAHICRVCGRLWFKLDLKSPSPEHLEIINKILPNVTLDEIVICNTCFASLKNSKISSMSTYNEFSYPQIPDHLPSLDLVSERLISPSIPFMQIRKLRHVNGQYGIYGQVINVGDVCISECKTFSGQIIIVIAIYISPNQSIDDIIYFIQRSLLVYSRRGAAILGRGEDKLPMILGGDFNVNFQSDESLPLVKFLHENFCLRMSNDPETSTTKSGKTIDALFSRHLDNIQSRTYISYFSYHKPIVSSVKINETNEDSMQIEEIN